MSDIYLSHRTDQHPFPGPKLTCKSCPNTGDHRTAYWVKDGLHVSRDLGENLETKDRLVGPRDGRMGDAVPTSRPPSLDPSVPEGVSERRVPVPGRDGPQTTELLVPVSKTDKTK